MSRTPDLLAGDHQGLLLAPDFGCLPDFAPLRVVVFAGVVEVVAVVDVLVVLVVALIAVAA